MLLSFFQRKFKIFICVLGLAPMAVLFTNATSDTLIGNVEQIDSAGNASGWAAAVNVPNYGVGSNFVSINLYADEISGPTYLGSTVANQLRSDGQHVGFSFNIMQNLPLALKDGKAHKLVAVAGYQNSSWTILSGNLVFTSPASMLGALTQIDASGNAVGWAYNNAAPGYGVNNNFVSINFYADEISGPTYLGSTEANVILYGWLQIGFSYNIMQNYPVALRDGKPHKLVAVAGYQGGMWTILPGSPTYMPPTDVIGGLEQIDASGNASGWATDIAAANYGVGNNFVSINFYGDEISGPTYIGSTIANQMRSDGQRVGFSFNIMQNLPPALKDGKPHALVAVAGYQAASWTILPGSPSFTGPVPVVQTTNFTGACWDILAGYTLNAARTGLNDILLPQSPSCPSKGAQLLSSVSHETLQSGHSGDANNMVGPVANPHMADYVYASDWGRWVNATLDTTQANPVLSMSLDTIDYQDVTPTGRPIQNGHLFFGTNDLTTNANFAANIFVEFDYRVMGSQLNQAGYSGSVSGQRLMLGALGVWQEGAGRSNTAHYMEVDLYKSPLYTFNESINPNYCAGNYYDRCFYDLKGASAEGRYISYQTYLNQPAIPLNGVWTHIKIPLSQMLRSLNWLSPPAAWSAAQLSGLYFGIESMGASRAWIQVQNYQVYRQ